MLDHSAPMLRSGTHLRQMRRERLPFVVLGVVALVARLLLLSLGLSGSVVAPAGAADWPGVLLCTSDATATQPASGHDPIHCACGPACLHLGYSSALPPIVAGPALDSVDGQTHRLIAGSTFLPSRIINARQIRGPPSA